MSDQISEGQNYLRKIVSKNGDWYVTLHVREGKGNNYTNLIQNLFKKQGRGYFKRGEGR